MRLSWLDHWLDRLGDWNPQLLRELKGRMKPRTVILAVATSLLGQGLLFMFLQGQIPVVVEGVSTYRSRYCTGPEAYYKTYNCLRDASGDLVMNWPHWWLDLFNALGWALPLVLIIGGVYALISDLTKEERRGTLNFLRLSPRSSQSILVGKILGVPVLPYLIVAVAVPLHLWAALAAQVPFSLVLSFYAVSGAVCGLFYSAALFYTLAGGNQAWLGSLAVLALVAPLAGALQSSFEYGASNQALTIWLWSCLLLLVSCSLWTYWIWQALNRRFRNPNTTLISKQQSYGLTASLQLQLLLIIGFFWLIALISDTPGPSRSQEDMLPLLYIISSLNLCWFAIVLAALTPHRQTLQDWARYRHQQATASGGGRNRSLLQDLIWGEKSPAIVAVAVNLVIANALWGLMILAFPSASQRLQALAGLVLSLSLILIYAAITQLLLLMRTQKRALWAVGAVGAAVVLPPLVLAALALTPEKMALPWLFSAFSAAAVGQASLSAVCLALLAQWGFFCLLCLRLTRQLQQAGASASKPLLAGQTS